MSPGLHPTDYDPQGHIIDVPHGAIQDRKIP